MKITGQSEMATVSQIVLESDGENVRIQSALSEQGRGFDVLVSLGRVRVDGMRLISLDGCVAMFERIALGDRGDTR